MDESVHPCPECGGPLPPSRGERHVLCTFCNKTHPHPVPVPEGWEVLVPGTFSDTRDLARVVECTSADSIRVDGDHAGTFSLEEITPVIRPDRLEPNMQVFYRHMHGWKLTYVASVQGHVVRVKSSSGEAFQSGFFDESVSRSDILVHRHASKRFTRKAPTLLDKLKARPLDYIVQGFIIVVFLLIALPIVAGLLFY